MGGRCIIAAAILAGALALQPPALAAEFTDFHLTRLRYAAPEEAPEAGAAPNRFFRTAFGLRATFKLASGDVDLMVDPIRVSFGSFHAEVGPERKPGDTPDELHYSARRLNWLRRLFLKKTGGDFRLRLRATRLSIERPEHFTIEIGDHIAQVDLQTFEPSTPRAFVHGLIAARRPQAGASGAVVRAPCSGGTCRQTTDDKGRFGVETDAGEPSVTIDATLLANETLSRVTRPVLTRPGTNDAGLVVLPPVNENAGVWLRAGAQLSGAIVVYPSGTEPEVLVSIPEGAAVELPGSSAGARRFSVSRLLKEMLPVATPAGIAPASAYVVEPAGARVTPCADVLVRNPFPGLPDGATVDLFALDAGGAWSPVASGTVVDNRSVIRADGALCELSSFFVGCPAEHTSVRARVMFRGTPLPGVFVSLQGASAVSTASEGEEPNVVFDDVAAGCAGNANSMRAHSALPLVHGYLSGVSASVTTAPNGITDLGDIALALCGDGVVEAPVECDGENVGQRTCINLGYQDGFLGCTSTCVLDVAGCRTCGNSIASAGEECDGLDDSLCPGACRSDCSCPPVCGDGVRNQSDEECDGGNDTLCANRCTDECRCPDPEVTTTTLPPSDCPIEFQLTPSTRALSTTGAAGFEIGYSGLGHDRDVAGGRAIALNVTCEREEAPCGSCTIDGLAAVDARCADSPSVSCNVIDAPDQECGGGLCHAYFLPPLHNLWGGGPSCFIERLTADVSGTIDNESGAAELGVALAGDMYFGVSPTQPCPVCKGDGAPNDGRKEGKCVGGISGGDECDANGVDPTFGNTSFDCLPGAAMLGSTTPVTRRLQLSTAGDTLSYSLPCDFPNQHLACPCATCAGDTSVACASDADCTAAGTTGPCGRRGAGALRKPNVCDGNACADTGDGIHGTCATGPDELFCDGMLFAHGAPYLPCLTNADCAAIDEACAGDCGECTITKRRACFVDPIETPVFATPTRAVLSDVLCMAPGASQGLDLVAGLAGPERVMLEVGIRRIFEGTLPDGVPRRPPGARRR
jgi:hypothetical protein